MKKSSRLSKICSLILGAAIVVTAFNIQPQTVEAAGSYTFATMTEGQSLTAGDVIEVPEGEPTCTLFYMDNAEDAQTFITAIQNKTVGIFKEPSGVLKADNIEEGSSDTVYSAAAKWKIVKLYNSDTIYGYWVTIYGMIRLFLSR